MKLNKLLFITVIILTSILLMTFHVNASEVDPEVIDQPNNEVLEAENNPLLELLPTSLVLDIPESNYEKAENYYYKKVEDILKEQKVIYEFVNSNELYETKFIKISNYPAENIYTEIHFFYSGMSIEFDDFYIATFDLEQYKINEKGQKIDGTNVLRQIELTYTTRENYNREDAKKANEIVINQKDYHILNFDNVVKSNNVLKYELETSEKYYTNSINDKTVIIRAVSFAGGGYELASTNDVMLGVFINGVFYRIIHLDNNEVYITEVNVPKTVADKDIENFVAEKIATIFEKNEYIKENLGNLAITAAKGNIVPDSEEVFCSQVPNLYTISIKGTKSDEIFYDFVTVKRDIEVNKKDEKSNIKLEADSTIVPENTILVVNELKEGTSFEIAEKSLEKEVEKFVVYDITLQSNGVSIQPNGKVKISIPIPKEFNKDSLVAYRVEENGNKTKYAVKVETVDDIDYAIFETDHFSIYTLAVNKSTPTQDKTTTQTTNKTPSKEQKVENTETATEKSTIVKETPKTGDTEILIWIAMVIISTIGIIGTAKLQQKIYK